MLASAGATYVPLSDDDALGELFDDVEERPRLNRRGGEAATLN